MIEARELTKRFGPTLAIDRVSFHIAKGEVVGLLGPNGAGKSTTMRILTGFVAADGGSATVAGHDIDDDSLAVRRRIGYLPESAPLYGEMLVEECLAYVSAIRAIPAGERTAKIRRVAAQCGLEPVLGQSIGTLSKGYRQRVGLAQTLIHEPAILILDEPTSGLDPNQIVEIRALIQEIGKERTVILSTHILPEVEAACDRVIIIDRGRVVASDTPRNLARAAAGAGHFLADVRGPEAEVVDALRALPAVGAAHAIEATGGRVRIRVDGAEDNAARSDPHALGEAISQAVAAHGWPLAELRHEAPTLEHVFRELTRKPATPAARGRKAAR